MKMTAHVDKEVSGNVLEFELHGTLTREDYDKLTPEIERIIGQHGRIRVLVIMHDFHGWDAGAFWEAIKWNSKHFRHLERLAVVGDKSIETRDAGAFDMSYRRPLHWQRWLTNFYRPFTNAEVGYFTTDELGEAREWLYGESREALIERDARTPAQTP